MALPADVAISGLEAAERGVNLGNGPQVSKDGKTFLNIMDPDMEGKWETELFALNLDPLEGTKVETCEDECREKMKAKRENCVLVRKRVQAALKKMGCDSVVSAPKKRKEKETTYKKTKTTKAKKPCR